MFWLPYDFWILSWLTEFSESYLAKTQMAQGGEHQIQVAEVQGSMLTGVISLNFLFSRSKACDVNIVIIAISAN